MTEPSSPIAEPRPLGERSPGLFSPGLVRIAVAQALFGFGWCLFLVQPKFLTVELGVGPKEVGATLAFGGAAGVVAILLVLRLIDRRGGRRFLFLLGAALLFASSVAYLFVERFGPLLYVIQVGLNAAYVFSFNAAMALVTDVAPKDRMGQAFGIQSAANLGMNAVSTSLAEWVSAGYGWKAVFLIAVVASVVAGVFGLGLPGESAEGSKDGASPERATPAPYAAVAPILLTALLLGMTFVAMFAFHQPYAISLGAQRVGAFFVGFTAAALAMRLGFGGLGDRFGHRPVAMLAVVLYALVPLTMSTLSTSALWMYGAGLGIAHGIVYPTLTALATERALPETRGRIIAAYSGSFHAGSTLGSLAWGQVAAASGYPRVFHGATVAAIVGLIALFLSRPRDATT